MKIDEPDFSASRKHGSSLVDAWSLARVLSVNLQCVGESRSEVEIASSAANLLDWKRYCAK